MERPRIFGALLLAALGATSAAVAQGPMDHARPDLVVDSIRFEVVQASTWGSGNRCHIFNVTVTVKNVGEASAGPTTLRLDRKMSGTWGHVCPTCLLAVGTLRPGMSDTLDPRQFNNCGNGPDLTLFRATADSESALLEANETNNVRDAQFRLVLTRPTVRPAPSR